METRERTSGNGTPYPNIPPLMENRESEYVGSGVTSTVAIAGHPLHPALVVFPIGILCLVAGTDLGYLFTGDIFWARASIWLIGVGFVAGIVAAITGILDFTRIKRVRQRTAGWAHMYVNATALVLTAINFGLRLGGIADAIVPIGLVLSLIVATLLGLGGWFGGELTFRHKVGVIGTGSREE